MSKPAAPELFTAWITKYALSKGILKLEVELCDNDMIACRDKCPTWFHGEGKDWHRTPEAALARADNMRKKKLVTLAKQARKLEGLHFEAPL